MGRTTSLAAFLLATCALGLGGCGDDSDALKVGVVLPMTGDQSTYGEESWNGLQLAADDLRAEGTPVEFEVILRDEKSEAKEAETQAKNLMELEGVPVLVGSVASSITKAIGKASKDMGVPCITPASTNDTLTKDNPYLSRICYDDGFQGSVLARFALQQGWNQAAVVVDKKNDYSIGLSDNFVRDFEAQGGETKRVYFQEKDTDFSPVIHDVAGYGPDVVFIAGYYQDAGKMIKQAKDPWEGLTILAGDGVDSPEFIPLLGDAGNVIYFSTHFAPDQPEEKVQSFAKRYEKRFGKEPGAMAGLGYDVLFVLMDAAKRAENPKDPESLAKAIRETKDVKGVTGTISLDNPERTPTKRIVFVKVHNGKREYHSTVEP